MSIADNNLEIPLQYDKYESMIITICDNVPNLIIRIGRFGFYQLVYESLINENYMELKN